MRRSSSPSIVVGGRRSVAGPRTARIDGSGQALDALEPFLAKLEFRLFASEIHRRFFRGQLKSWMASQLAVVTRPNVSSSPSILALRTRTPR